MRKISIIADTEDMPLAYTLLDNVDKCNIHDSISDIKKTITMNLKEKLSSSSIILIIISKSMSRFLLKEIQLAVRLSSEDKHIKLIPILIDNAPIPNYLKDFLVLNYDTNSKEDKIRIQTTINRIITNIQEEQYNSNKRNDINIKSRSTKELTILTGILMAFTSLAMIVSLFIERRTEYSLFYEEEPILIMLIVLVFTTLAIFISTYYISLRRRNRIEKEDDMELYAKRLRDAISIEEINTNTNKSEKNEEIVQTEIDALGRMLINLEDIKEFYTWSQKQAKASFILAIAMCIVGFILIATSIVFTLIFNIGVNISIVTAIGGVITELVAGTALVVYKSSLTQLNHYHKALHEDERFLSSANLLGKFSNDDARDEMLKEIIRSEIQMNLKSIENIEFQK